MYGEFDPKEIQLKPEDHKLTNSSHLIGATKNSGAQLPQRHLYVVLKQEPVQMKVKAYLRLFVCFRVTLGWELNMGPIQLGSWDLFLDFSIGYVSFLEGSEIES